MRPRSTDRLGLTSGSRGCRGRRRLEAPSRSRSATGCADRDGLGSARPASVAASAAGARRRRRPGPAPRRRCVRRWCSRRSVGSPPSKPAAMTVTRTSSPRVSSMTAPKMMLASGCAASLHELRGVVDLEDAEVRPALDREQHAVRAVDATPRAAGTRDGELGGLDRAVGAARGADAHERGARALHDRLDVGEVEVDETRAS